MFSSLKVGTDVVTLRHRVCGGVAGYALRIAPPDADVTSRVDEVEPFLTSCLCFDPRAAVPITIQLIGDRHLRVTYDAEKMLSVDKQRIHQGEYTIDYAPVDAGKLP